MSQPPTISTLFPYTTLFRSIVNTYKDAIDQLEEAWEKGIELAKLIGTELSYGEILEALEAGGVTKYDIVFEPKAYRSEEHTSELQSRGHLVCRLLLEKKNKH